MQTTKNMQIKICKIHEIQLCVSDKDSVRVKFSSSILYSVIILWSA